MLPLDVKDKLGKYKTSDLVILALAIYSESANGNYPITVLEILAWVYLNREQGGYGKWTNLISTIVGNNSGIQSSRLARNMSELKMINEKMEPIQLNAILRTVIDKINNPGLTKALEAAFSAINNSQSGGVDPTGGAVSFRQATNLTEWSGTLETAEFYSSPRSANYPDYHFTTVDFHSPYSTEPWNNGLGSHVWIIFDNRDAFGNSVKPSKRP